MRSNLRNLFIGWLTAACVLVGAMPVHAGMIGTENLVAAQSRDAAISRVDAFMARQDVQAQLQAWGVAPATAAERVASLSDAELRELATNIESQPAGGGALTVIGVVFLVLLLLELVGVIDIFKKV